MTRFNAKLQITLSHYTIRRRHWKLL